MKVKKSTSNIKLLINNIKQEEAKCDMKIYVGSFLLNFLLISATILSKNSLPPEVPLFYGLPEGEKQVVKWWFLVIPSIAAISFTAINLLICKRSKDNLIKKLSTYILIPINFFSFIAIIKIIILVGRI